MIAKLAKQGFKVVTIVDPGVKNDPKFGVLRRGEKAGAFVRAPDGKGDFLGEVWPGEARFPDFLNEAARVWWGDEQKALQDAGVAGFWNDMNEPANFARPDKTLAPDALHATDHGPAKHVDVHNLYGMQMSRASREGALRHRPDERPFVVTRATYAGGQRYSIVWTGDNSSCWEHLADSIQMFLNLGLSGAAFCGGDVGGFLDNTTPELLVRWLQFAAFTPFFRNHSNLGTIAQEPWAFGKEAEELCRTWIGLRYQFLPYWYALVAEAHRTGTPPMRPLLWHHPNDAVAVACGDQFLLGRNVLVAPVTRQGCAARAVYLPNDVWFDFWTGERHEGGRHVLAPTPIDRIPVFIRAGSLLPLADTRQHLDGPADATITLHVWPGPRSELAWYEDDGTSRAHERGESMARTLVQTTTGRTLRIEFGAETGAYSSGVRTWRVVVWGARKPAPARVNGVAVESSYADDAGVLIAEVPNSPGAFLFEYAGL
jgi:alpha-glucosidase